MIKGQHGVGFAAAEVGLKLHHRIAALARQPQKRIAQKLAQAAGNEGAGEKLPRVAVLIGTLAL